MKICFSWDISNEKMHALFEGVCLTTVILAPGARKVGSEQQVVPHFAGIRDDPRRSGTIRDDPERSETIRKMCTFWLQNRVFYSTW